MIFLNEPINLSNIKLLNYKIISKKIILDIILKKYKFK